MIRQSVASLLVASIVALAGCADDAISADLAAGHEGNDLSEAATDEQLIGTFRAQEVGIGELMLLVIKADATYHYGMAIVCAAKPDLCGPIQDDGYYKLTHNAPYKYIDLFDVAGNAKARFQYDLDGDTLQIRRLDTGGEWRSMKRTAPPWCAVPNDCGLQNLPEARCVGEWSCATNACAFQCEPHPCEEGDYRCQSVGSVYIESQP
jgi:hypothetical protein